MTKKDYIIIADSISKARTSLLYASVNAPETKRCIDYVINHLCMSLKRENVRFDENRFALACKHYLSIELDSLTIKITCHAPISMPRP